MVEYHIRVQRHIKTGLWMAEVEDLPGFVVHAHSKDELKEKLAPALKSFMKATDRPAHDWEVITDPRTVDFDPPAYIAKAALDQVAA